MSIGLIFFTLADSKVQPNFNTYGVIVICSALVADAVIGNYQEKIMKTYNVSNVEIVFYSFMFGFLIILVGLLLTNNFFFKYELLESASSSNIWLWVSFFFFWLFGY